MSSLENKGNSEQNQLLNQLPQFEIKNCNALQIVDQRHTANESSVVLHHVGTAANFYCNLKQFEFHNGLEILFSSATFGELSPTYSFGISSTKNVISAGYLEKKLIFPGYVNSNAVSTGPCIKLQNLESVSIIWVNNSLFMRISGKTYKTSSNLKEAFASIYIPKCEKPSLVHFKVRVMDEDWYRMFFNVLLVQGDEFPKIFESLGEEKKLEIFEKVEQEENKTKIEIEGLLKTSMSKSREVNKLSKECTKAEEETEKLSKFDLEIFKQNAIHEFEPQTKEEAKNRIKVLKTRKLNITEIKSFISIHKKEQLLSNSSCPSASTSTFVAGPSKAKQELLRILNSSPFSSFDAGVPVNFPPRKLSSPMIIPKRFSDKENVFKDMSISVRTVINAMEKLSEQVSEKFKKNTSFNLHAITNSREIYSKIEKFDQNLNEIKKKLSEISEKKIKLTNANPECVKDMISKTKDSLGGQLDQNSNCNSFVDVLKKMKTSGELIKVEIDREIMRLKEKFKLHEHEGSDMDSFLCSVCLDRKKNIAFSPCGHVCICDQCDVNINSCPLCRQQIATRHKVFL